MRRNNNELANGNFINYAKSNPGWGMAYRRKLCVFACKHLGIPLDQLGSNPSDSAIISTIKNGLGIGLHSVLNTSSITLIGSSLEKIKSDPGLLKKQQELINDIRKNKKRAGKSHIYVQFGGPRARGKMWKQALGFWKTEYRATWKVAFNELTWTVRSTGINFQYGC